ncbi:hypothetical protein AURDEDRAFT_150765 [Auricularia subglabra TFB-10046 SS5]|nr:hypothetical protein AURDEDRAFT_150765 [Auricularia subglabra TFB-10046 SS5]
MPEQHPGHSAGIAAQPTSGSAQETPLVPLELVAAIMRYLGPEDLRKMAAACRQYKAAAYQHAGLTIRIQREAILPPDEDAVQRMAACRDIVRHALKHELRLELDIRCYVAPALGPSPPGTTAAVLQWVGDMCTSISEGLAVLVSLTLVVPDVFRATLDAAMRHPAPHLRVYSLSATMGPGQEVGHPVPLAVFNGSAPKLDRVVLHDALLGNVAIPAFETARSIELEYAASAPAVDVSTAFPAARQLEFVCYVCGPDEDATLCFNLHGLAIDKLTAFDDLPYVIFDYIDPPEVVHQIPVVVHNTFFPFWCPTFWPTVPGDLSMRIVDQRASGIHTLVTIVTAAHHYTRAFEMRDILGGADDSPLLQLGFLAARFAYLRIDSIYLEDLFAFAGDLPALRRLQIDIPGTSSSPNRLCARQTSVRSPCPILKDVVIFAMDRHIQISCDETGFLAKALGLDTHPAPHAVLTLVGVDLTVGKSPSLLPSTFPTVVYRQFTGRGTSDDQEAGLWDY